MTEETREAFFMNTGYYHMSSDIIYENEHIQISIL